MDHNSYFNNKGQLNMDWSYSNDGSVRIPISMEVANSIYKNISPKSSQKCYNFQMKILSPKLMHL